MSEGGRPGRAEPGAGAGEAVRRGTLEGTGQESIQELQVVWRGWSPEGVERVLALVVSLPERRVGSWHVQQVFWSSWLQEPRGGTSPGS